MSFFSLVQGVMFLYDANSNPVAVPDGTAVPANQGLLQVGGKGADSNAHPLRMANDGTVRVDPSGTTTQPVSAAALPLPAGASTEAKQDTIISHVDGLEALLTSLNGVDFATSAGQATIIGHIDGVEGLLTTIDSVLDSINAKDFATETTLAAQLNITLSALRDAIAGTSPNNNTLYDLEQTLETIKTVLDSLDAKDFSTSAKQDTIIGHVDGLESLLTQIDAVLDTIYTRLNDRTQKTQLTNGTLDVNVTSDAGINRLEILGKVQVTGATPPPATTPAVIFGDTPLTVGTQDNTFVIPNGETFYLQEIVAGNEDPTKGASVEVIYYNGTEHLIARIYIAGTTLTVGYPDRSVARDGTAMIGNAGGTNTIICRRAKYSGSDIAIDAVVRGYTL